MKSEWVNAHTFALDFHDEECARARLFDWEHATIETMSWTTGTMEPRFGLQITVSVLPVSMDIQDAIETFGELLSQEQQRNPAMQARLLLVLDELRDKIRWA